MALQGLFLTTLGGWVGGIFLLDKPWGRPIFTSWFSLSIFILLINSCLQTFFFVDAMVHFSAEILAPFVDSGTSQSIHKLLNRFSLAELASSNYIIRVILIVQAKKLADLWGNLYMRNERSAKECKFFQVSFLSIIVTVGSQTLALALGFLDGLPVAKQWEKSMLGKHLGYTPYLILVVIYLIGPYISPTYCGFGSILATMNHLQHVYSKYCKKVLDLMQLKIMQDPNSRTKERFVLPVEMKGEMVKEFQEIQRLFNLADCCIGPLLFILLSGGSLRLVFSASKIALRNTEEFWDIQFFREMGHILGVLCQLVTLEVGQNALSLFAEWKGKLRQASVQLSTCSSNEAKDLNDLYLIIDDWNWNLSACGFFDVDRKLASGIISYLVTYVVIMVQARIAVEGQ